MSLLALPLELHYLLASFLPPASLIALKLSHPHFHHTLPITFKPRNLDACAALAIRTYLDPHLTTTTERRRCVLCKEVYPASLFDDEAGAKASRTLGGPGPIELPERVCAWHRGRLCRVVRSGDALRPDASGMDDGAAVAEGKRPGWSSRMEVMCMCCGTVRAWSGCRCECASCGEREVRTYTRRVGAESECRRFVFYRRKRETGLEGAAEDTRGEARGEGELWVTETSWEDDNPERRHTIELPVHFE